MRRLRGSRKRPPNFNVLSIDRRKLQRASTMEMPARFPPPAFEPRSQRQTIVERRARRAMLFVSRAPQTVHRVAKPNGHVTPPSAIATSGPADVACVDSTGFVSNTRQSARWFLQGWRQPSPLLRHISIVQSYRRQLPGARCSFPCSGCTSRD